MVIGASVIVGGAVVGGLSVLKIILLIVTDQTYMSYLIYIVNLSIHAKNWILG